MTQILHSCERAAWGSVELLLPLSGHNKYDSKFVLNPRKDDFSSQSLISQKTTNCCSINISSHTSSISSLVTHNYAISTQKAPSLLVPSAHLLVFAHIFSPPNHRMKTKEFLFSTAFAIIFCGVAGFTSGADVY